MDFRRTAAGVICFFAAIAMSAQGISFGALDVITGSKSDVAAAAVETVVENVKSGKSGSAFGALDFVTSDQGSLRQGALNAIIKAASGDSYYTSGAMNLPAIGGYESIGSNASKWIGQMLPVPQWGQITSGFGFRPRFGRMHKGIDISMSVGDTVSPPLAGVVDRVNYEAGGYGNYIVVRHENGLETRYAHLSRTLVGPGERVYPGMPIALSGNTGNSTGPHLHFETRINGTAVDPREIFNFAGGKVLPRYRSVTEQYSTTPAGALSQVVDNGVRGRSLNERRTYVVKAGDTLQKIAGLAGVSVLDLCKMNFISETDPLTPGTMIRLRK